MLCVIEFSIHVIKISLNSIEIKKKKKKRQKNVILIYACAIENHLKTIFNIYIQVIIVQ